MSEKKVAGLECKAGCAACCIVISISSPLPGMPNGKPAGQRCINLDKNNRCTIHGTKKYPEVCQAFSPTVEICGTSTEHAWTFLRELEDLTSQDLML